MNKGWLVILLSIFITVLIWSGFEVYSCFGGYSPDIFGLSLPTCKYIDEEDLLKTEVTPVPDNLSLDAIKDIKDEDALVIIKDKSEL